MKAAECKPGDHLWMMPSYDGALEVEVLQPLEPIYQDFVWVQIIQCPPGWKSPRYIRAAKLYPTKKAALKAAIIELEISIAERERKIKHLQEEITRKHEQSINLSRQYAQEAE